MASLIRISEAASLALHAMAVFAHEPDARFTNHQVAELLGASSHHLAKVTAKLVKSGLVRSAVGPGGGFQLARPASDVRLLEIYEVAEGPIDSGSCLLSEPVCDGKDCMLGELFVSVHNQIRTCLEETTLADLANRIGFLSSKKALHFKS